jgi:hypothetical protein
MADTNTYRIQTTGDGAHVREVTGTWDDLVTAVTAELYFRPTDADRQEVLRMLDDGLDGDAGWDGRHVHLTFEDGSLRVDLIGHSAEGCPDAQ